ncbi:hypothetical protein ETD83_37775 [Actinomadura soli]|uniref:Extensin n=1 Tax=Actinomadura soli TaxID=2508997 RepID=A0A5C4IZX9_9ACTN|nr:hypothetical protein [Actinomadura soli]TMQ89903.1 hypothetical protein ETD83_37775 [Actinomadura soli]
MATPITAQVQEATGLAPKLPVQRRMPVPERPLDMDPEPRLPDPPPPRRRTPQAGRMPQAGRTPQTAPSQTVPSQTVPSQTVPSRAMAAQSAATGPVASRDEARPVAPRRDEGRPDARRPEEMDVDELARHLLGPLARLLRAELRMDRERVGRLRDPRNY